MYKRKTIKITIKDDITIIIIIIIPIFRKGQLVRIKDVLICLTLGYSTPQKSYTMKKNVAVPTYASVVVSISDAKIMGEQYLNQS